MLTLRCTAVVTVLVVVALGLAACGQEPPQPATTGASSGTPVVYATNYPLAYFAERIGGDDVRVELPVPPGEDPAWWRPDDATISAYQQADLILLNGATYEKWVEKASLPPARTVDTSKRATDHYLEMQGVVTHAHGPEGAHEHRGTAFTTWLDLHLAAIQAEAIRDALTGWLPDRSEAIRSRYDALRGELEALDTEIPKVVASDPTRFVVFSHPVYQYLAKAYGIQGAEVHWEPGEMPSEEAWAAFDELLAKRPVHWMIWEGPPDDAIVAKLRARGIECVVFDPCGNRPAEGDFLSVMRRNVDDLRRIYEAR